MAWRLKLLKLLPSSATRILFFVRNKDLYVWLLSLYSFPGVFVNLYMVVRTVDPMRVVNAFLSLAGAFGSSVDRLLVGLRLLQGEVAAEKALGMVFFSGYPDWLLSVMQNEFVLGLYLVLAAVTTPWLFYRFWNWLIRWLSSTTPAIEHYVLLTGLYLALILVYSFQHGRGVAYLGEVIAEVVQTLDGLAQGASEGGGNATGANGSIGSSSATSK